MRDLAVHRHLEPAHLLLREELMVISLHVSNLHRDDVNIVNAFLFWRAYLDLDLVALREAQRTERLPDLLHLFATALLDQHETVGFQANSRSDLLLEVGEEGQPVANHIYAEPVTFGVLLWVVYLQDHTICLQLPGYAPLVVLKLDSLLVGLLDEDEATMLEFGALH